MKNVFVSRVLFAVILFIFFSSIYYLVFVKKEPFLEITSPPKQVMKITSVDTMKYSRDVAREKLHDASFDTVIDRQVSDIAKTGATHIAIGAPYDDEFTPFLKRWVQSARAHGLKVWFRGNFSGWEGWFNYPKIDRETHIKKTQSFIFANKDLFENGDIFGSCNECENGGPGDPRHNGDVEGHRIFLIEEYKVARNAFNKIGKKVRANYNSMNGDVANLIMNKDTTKALDGIVVIDHYVKDPEKLITDIQELSQKSGGKIVLGEFGAPIPDIHGNMTEEEQADWIRKALDKVLEMPEVIGVNYWVNVGGSTHLWNNNGKEKLAVSVIRKYYLKNKLKAPLPNL